MEGLYGIIAIGFVIIYSILLVKEAKAFVKSNEELNIFLLNQNSNYKDMNKTDYDYLVYKKVDLAGKCIADIVIIVIAITSVFWK